jgi:hypothetical protein
MNIMMLSAGSLAALTVNGSLVSAHGSGFVGCGNAGSTGTPGVSVSGGSGNYAFSWVKTSGNPDNGPWVISNAAVQNPTWRAPPPVCDGDLESSEEWELTVTDNQTSQTGKVAISVTISWSDLR